MAGRTYLIATFQKDIYYLLLLLWKSFFHRRIKIISAHRYGLPSLGQNRDNLLFIGFQKMFSMSLEKCFFWSDVEETPVFSDIKSGFLMHIISDATQKYFIENFDLDSDPLVSFASRQHKTDKIANVLKIRIWWTVFNAFCMARYLTEKGLKADYIYNSLSLDPQRLIQVINMHDVTSENSVFKNRPFVLTRIAVVCLYIQYLLRTIFKLLSLKIVFRREKFIYAVEAIWGLDFSSDKNTVFWKRDKENMDDVLFYSYGKPKEEGRSKTRQEALSRGYRHVNIRDTGVNVKYFWAIIHDLHIVPFLVLKEYLTRDTELHHIYLFMKYYMGEFYTHYFFCANYDFRVETNYVAHYGLAKAAAYNLWGSRLACFSYSDLKQAVIANVLYWPICDDYVSVGTCQNTPFAAADKVHEIGYYMFNCGDKDKIRADIRNCLGWTDAEKVLSVFDETFGIFHMYTYEYYMKFYKAVLRIAREFPGVKICIKQKYPYKHYVKEVAMSAGEADDLLSLHGELKSLGNTLYIALVEDDADDNSNPALLPLKGINPEKLILASDVALTMQMHSSSTNANIFGIPGLYYCPGGLNPHPVAKAFYNRLVFEDEELLVAAVGEITAGNAGKYIVDDKLCREYFGVRSDSALDNLYKFMEDIACADTYSPLY